MTEVGSVSGRVRALHPAGLQRGVGRLRDCDLAGGTVITRWGTLRATWGGRLLAAVAADPAAAPSPGDLVEWLRWPGGVVTVHRRLRGHS